MENKIKILILDDNLTDAVLTDCQLKKSMFNFVSKIVDDQESYEKALTEFNPHIILSDYSLPCFSGLDAFLIKQQISPDVPFIIVTGTVGEEKAVELIKNGIDDYALKDKLFGLSPKIYRALHDANERKAKRFADEKLQAQYKQLLEIAFMQSHQVRAPIATILGLISLVKYDNLNDPNIEILTRLKTSAEIFDGMIRMIVAKTDQISNAGNLNNTIQ